jgi:uncharacterized protein (DUF4415 family)
MPVEWDPRKARLNAGKHGVQFADAVAVLEDERALRRPTSGGFMRKHMKREYDFSAAKRGPVMPVPKGKTRITIRLDDEVIAWFRNQVEKAGGGNYQSLVNDALRGHMARSREPLEATLRRVIREEIRRAS